MVDAQPVEKSKIDSERPVLAIEGLGKSFGKTPALRDVSLSVFSGEVHGLVGHNGSGKSTLIKIVSGYYSPDQGRVYINGREVSYPTNALTLARYGASFMHQDIGLVPAFSVMENLSLTNFPTGFMGHIRWRAEREHVREVLASFGLDIDPNLPVSRLSGAERAIVGILRAFSELDKTSGGGVLILDEPTASLAHAESERLFATVQDLPKRGIGVLVITHRLDEILKYAHRVTVLRNGERVATRPVGSVTEAELAGLIVGAAKAGRAPRRERAHRDQVVLEARNVAGETAKGVSFSAHKGEILGLTGLMGAGHEEVPFLLYGAAAPRRGEIALLGRCYSNPTPMASRRRGIAFVSGDRLIAGGVLPASIEENVSLPVLDAFVSPLGWIRRRSERSAVRAMLDRLGVTSARPWSAFSTLSGGNQQKALVGRWLASTPAVLLMRNPTSGVDIGAVGEVSRMVREFADNGGAVIISSEEYEDLALICDRVLVFQGGAPRVELTEGISRSRIVEACYVDREEG